MKAKKQQHPAQGAINDMEHLQLSDTEKQYRNGVQLNSKILRAANSTYKKLTVQWLNEAFPLRRERSCFVSSFVVADSLVLRNPPDRKASKRQVQP